MKHLIFIVSLFFIFSPLYAQDTIPLEIKNSVYDLTYNENLHTIEVLIPIEYSFFDTSMELTMQIKYSDSLGFELFTTLEIKNPTFKVADEQTTLFINLGNLTSQFNNRDEDDHQIKTYEIKNIFKTCGKNWQLVKKLE